MTTTSSRIAAAREAQGLNQSELARKLGVSPQSVQAWESGRTAPRNPRIKNLSEVLGVSVAYLMGESGPAESHSVTADTSLQAIEPWDESTPLDDDEVYVPFLHEVELAAGSGRFAIEESDSSRLRFFKKDLRHNGVQFSNAKCVVVSGNSMVPVLRDGATVGVNVGKNTLKDVVDGEMYAINHNGQLRIKQLFRLPTGIRLRSFNRDEHPDEEYSFQQIQEQQLSILGHVFWWAMYSR
ncbi:helix-turn-helix transcriptional regulator [Pseudomonas sp. B6002]|nr:helix-turn-helix transcriptional regulator [Pseudomonas sp. B6002]NVZ50252.1 helix-turn-helix transcriptional regulator [Pseudomonas sp. B6002]